MKVTTFGIQLLAGVAFAIMATTAISQTVPDQTVQKQTENTTITLSTASLEQLQTAMASGALSSVELTALYLNRIFAYDHNGPELNAVPVLNPGLLQEAARADKLRADGILLGPLHGIPVLFKDSINVFGLPTSVGMKAWKNMMPVEDAFLVAKMRQAGAIVMGKANLDSFAGDMTGVSEAFGAITNPYGSEIVSGSSGGSAVAVTASLTGLSFGTDTAGSLRMPASRNNIVSIRPTLGLISTAGICPADPLFDVVGPMARTVRDLALVLDVVVAQDPENFLEPFLPPMMERRPASYMPPPIDDTSDILHGVTFAFPERLAAQKSAPPAYLSPGQPILDVFAVTREKLISAGARVIEIDVPVDQVLDDTWYEDRDVSDAGPEAEDIYAARVALANIRVFAWAFEKFCRGWCGDPADRMLDVLALINGQGFRERFEALRDGRGLEITSSPASDALRNAAALADGPLFGGWMDQHKIDALLFPASSDVDADPLYGFNYLNELGVPGLFIPMGYVDKAAGSPDVVYPVGLTIVGKRFDEQKLLRLGAAIESVLQARVLPVSTPALPDETISLTGTFQRPEIRNQKKPPHVTIESVSQEMNSSELIITGTLAPGIADNNVSTASAIDLRVYVNGQRVPVIRSNMNWTARWSNSGLAGSESHLSQMGIIAMAKDSTGNSSAVLWP